MANHVKIYAFCLCSGKHNRNNSHILGKVSIPTRANLDRIIGDRQKSPNKPASTALAASPKKTHFKIFMQVCFLWLVWMFGVGAAEAALTLTLEMNPDTVQAGQRLRTELTVTNDGGGSVTNVVLQADYPSNVNNLSQGLLTGGGSCSGSVCSSGDLVTWNLGTLAPGAGVTVTMPMVVNGATADGTSITLTAAVTGDAVTTVNDSHSVVVNSGSSLRLELDENVDPVLAGGDYEYTLTYGNRGVYSASGTTLSLPLPAGTTLVSASGGGVQVGDVVEWSLGTVAAGEAGEQRVVVSVDGALGAGTVLAVDAAQLSATVNFLPETARAMAVTRVGTEAPLALGMEVNPDPVRPGQRLRSELTVSNQSGAALFGVVLQARFPDGMSNLTQGLLTGGGTCSGSVCSSGDLVTWNLGTLAPGAGVTVAMPMVALGNLVDGALINLDVEARADGGRQLLSAHTVAVDGDGSLRLELDENVDPVLAGGDYEYTLTYGNRGVYSASGTTLSLPLPAGTTLVSASGGGVQVGDVVEWSLGTVAAGEAGEQRVVVSVDGALGAGTVLAVDAAQLSATVNFLPETARAMAVTRVGTEAPLALGMEVNPDPVRPGQRLRSELTVSNQSGAALFGVVLQARFPDGMSNLTQGLLTGGGTCSGSVCSSGDLVTWNLGTLAPGAGVTVAMPMVALGNLVDGALINLDVEVRADGGRQLLSAHTVAVDGDGSLRLELDESPDPSLPDGVLKYILTFGNRGLDSVSDVELHFPLPAGASLVGSSGGTFINGEVIWNLGTLLAGEGGRRYVTLTVDPASSPGNQLPVDSARINGTLNFLPEVARAMAVTRVENDRVLDLSMTVAPNPAQPGQTLQTDLTVTNRTGASVFGVVLLARFPDGVNNLSQASLTGGGTCSGGVCSSGELVTWNLGTLAAGATVTVSMPPVVSGNQVDGQLHIIDAAVTTDGGNGNQTLAAETVLIGLFSDGDGDGVATLFDNCTAVANPDQLDTDGDGYGNLCDGDLNNDGNTNTLDLNLYKQAHRTSVGDANYNPDADFNGNGVINTLDLNIYKGLHRKLPGPSCCTL